MQPCRSCEGASGINLQRIHLNVIFLQILFVTIKGVMFYSLLALSALFLFYFKNGIFYRTEHVAEIDYIICESLSADLQKNI